MRKGYVYIMTNSFNTVLYTGVSWNLHQRIEQHRSGKGSEFVKRYQIWKLVYYESFPHIFHAIEREKQIKGGSRRKKIKLIDSLNSKWRDLSDSIE
jgi:putative endonuclease